MTAAKRYIEGMRARIDPVLEASLPLPEGPSRTVIEAMRHAVLGGGKRLRPILCAAAFEATRNEAPSGAVLEAAAAIEMFHTYSLIHDDLPAMDDDDLRRGRPTTHRIYGDAVAILAGDALQSLAFEVLSTRPAGDALAPARALNCATLARSAGVAGMVGGQIADLEGEGTTPDAATLDWIHRHKTGALFGAAARIGAVLGGAAAPGQDAFEAYGMTLGLAFQIADDILDCTSTSQALGKTAGKDLAADKATYPALFGLDGARRRALDTAQRARAGLQAQGLLTEVLDGLATLAVDRTR